MSGGGRSGVGFALLVVLFDMMAASMVSPVMPPLILHMLGGDQARSAQTIGLLGAVFSAMQLLFGPLQGALSDHFGRRPVLIVSCLGLAGSQVISALAGSWEVLLAGRLLAGIAAANVSTATAYIADMLPPEDRAAGFGRIGVAFGAGLVLGPMVGGGLGAIGLRIPFWASAGVSLLNAGWAAFVLAESLPPQRRSPLILRVANPVGALGLLLTDRRLTRLALSNTLSMVAQQALVSVFMLSATIRFGWRPHTLGLAMGGFGLCYAAVGGLLVGPALRRLGASATLGVGMGFGVAGFATLALASNGTVYALAVPMLALWGLSGPVVAGAMSRTVGADAQGRLQGAATSLAGLAGMIGPALFGGVLALAIGAHVAIGLPFAIAAMLLLAAVPVAVGAIRSAPLSGKATRLQQP